MRVRFHGVRGSAPTPGPSTVRYLTAEGYRAPIELFVTHGHWDHVIGLPFFAREGAASDRGNPEGLG